jgi:hypothetical protein
MPRGIYITAKDLQTLEDCTESYAYRLLTVIRDALSKPKGKKITLKEYAQYRGIDVSEVTEALK